MASRFDTQLAADWERSFTELQETVVRRPGGDATKTEEVTAIVDRDHEAVARQAAQNGLVRDDTGERLLKPIALEIAASQANAMHDKWVVDGQVFRQISENIGEDGGSQTIVCVRSTPVKDRAPRTSNRR